LRQVTCGCIGKIKDAKEGRISRLFSTGLRRVRRDLDISNAIKTSRRTKSMEHALLSEKQRFVMSLDKTNLLNSEDSDADPEMTDHVSTSDGEMIESKIEKGPRWSKVLKSEGETYNVINRRLSLAVSRKRFIEEDTEQQQWVSEV